jgi:hypothetical protein
MAGGRSGETASLGREGDSPPDEEKTATYQAVESQSYVI